MSRIVYIGTYVPKRCGIATYTHHLRQSVTAAGGRPRGDLVFALADSADERGYEPGARLIVKRRRDDYRKAASIINASGAGVVSLQHEFGIFGGEAGEYALELLDRLDVPVVTTFHTVFEHPSEPYRDVQRRIAERSDRIVVMSRTAIRYVANAFGVPADKIAYIPHGTPEPLAESRSALRARFGWEGRRVVMSFGLLGRGKGLETIIRALPDVVRRVPETLYAVVGQTHPEVRKHEGESYRRELRKLAEDLGVERHLHMIDRYMDERELTAALMACDVYATPYPGLQQITSGTLAYAVGLGRPVLSTPYVYAEELLSGCPELLLPPSDEKAWSDKLAELLGDDAKTERLARRIAAVGAEMRWPAVGKAHLDLFERIARSAGMTSGAERRVRA